MANLKDLKNRIKSVKSTQKITKAMKMVAASKLRRAQERAEAGRPYSEKMERMVATLAMAAVNNPDAPKLLSGTGKDEVHLVVMLTTDRGLCGGLNSILARHTKQKIAALKAAGKDVKLLIVGRKGWGLMRHVYGQQVLDRISDMGKQKQVEYVEAEDIATRLLAMFEEGKFDVCHLIYNSFVSAISQVPTWQQLIPLDISALSKEAADPKASQSQYDYEPSEEAVLEKMLPKNLAVQLYHALLETAASEQGARMSAMDNATRNAGEMIGRLTLVYNRTRQAAITTELTEIISGAEAV